MSDLVHNGHEDLAANATEARREQLSKKTRRKIAKLSFTFNIMLIISILRRYPRQQDPRKHGIFWRIIRMGEKK